MAQQKIIIALCIVAVFAAIAAAQSSSSSSSSSATTCTQKLQEHSSNYRKEAQTQIQGFADRLRGHSNDAVDIEKFRKQSDELIEKFIQMVDVRGGFSFSRMTQAYTEFLESQIQMYQLFMRIDKAQDMTNEYYTLANSLSRMSTRYLLQAARDCLTGF